MRRGLQIAAASRAQLFGVLTIAALAVPLLAYGFGYRPDTALPETQLSEVEIRELLVGPDDLRVYPAGSPGRTVLAWWRQLQFQNPSWAAQYYAPSVHLPADRLASQLLDASQRYDLSRTQLTIEEVEATAKTAIVSILLGSPPESENGTIGGVEQLAVRRVNGNWLLADNRLIESIVASSAEAATSP